MSLVPRIVTPRLVLRAPQIEDLDAMERFWASERSHYVGGPKDRHGTWQTLLSMNGHWQVRGYGMWMLTCRETGAPGGCIGILHHDSWEEPELAWHVFEDFEGKGLAYEAARAARNHAAVSFGITRPVSFINPSNARTVALARRLGAQYERDGAVLGNTAQIWRHPEPEAIA